MKPVNMTSYGIGGNCLSAVLASILEVPIDEVPFFPYDLNDETVQMRGVQTWLKSKNLYLFEFAWEGIRMCQECIDHGGHVVATVKSMMGNGFMHAVVGQLVQNTDKTITCLIVHDPDDRHRGERKYDLQFVGILVPIKHG